ncbi:MULTISPECIES: quinone oxidoreductase family protein [Microbispora]|uniref:Quinone oxidoreductase n=1 Tax=Microbispora siamensis TaxID=564413 RepID=A0ABQ4GZL2_9ACTN|nr:MULTISPECIES: quinone oxidoreductase [Microbispora]OPG12357.1 NADPH:quinone reductase [Microbispora sp. GKU 823]GIH66734.1 quinone oxidoreductase [Microbispora siamensis]
MRAIVMRAAGGPEVLRLETVRDPDPGPGEALVEVTAAGVNFIDVYQRSGRYATPLPHTPGMEGAGVVRRVGAGVTGVRAGDRVAWVNVPGAYAELAVIPADRLVPVPPGVPARTAAAVLLQGMTAHYLLHDTYRVRPGDTVLVHAAAGGMGLLLVRWATLLGARVIGTVSTQRKEEIARSAGAAEIIRYDRCEVAARVRDLTRGRGVAAVYDGVGAPTFEASLAALRPRGVLALFGQSGGPVPPVDPQRLNAAGSVFLTRPNLEHHIAHRSELLARAAAVFDRVVAGDLEVRVTSVRPLAEAAQAHADLEERRSTGKLLLTTEEGRY